MSKVLLALAWLATLVVMKANGLNLQSSVVLDNGGYTNVVVAIDESLQENMDLLTAIQDMFRNASEFLYQATRNRVYFKNVTILIPSHWTNKPEYGSPGRLTFDTADVIIAQPNPLWAPEPYTLQIGGCGEPGSFIHFTEDFLTDDDVTASYGELGRILVHEWGHYRWGLFNEYPDEIGDSNHVTNFYQSPTGEWKPVTCAEGYETTAIRTFQRRNKRLYRPCRNGEISRGLCTILIQDAGYATGSIMNGQLTFPQIVNFCDNVSDTGSLHNREAPNKHNRLCGARSAWEVMREHADFKDGNSPPSDLNAAQIQPTFNLVQAGGGDECRVVLVLDTSGSMSTNNRIAKMNSAAAAFVNLVMEGIWVGIVSFTSSAFTQHSLTQIRTQADRDSLRDIFTFRANGGTCIGCGLAEGLEVLMQHPSGIVGGGIILLMTDGGDGGIATHPIRQTLQDMDVRVSTVAIGQDASGELTPIALETGGIPLFHPDDSTADSVSGLTETVDMCTAVDNSQRRIQLVGEGFSLDSGNSKEGDLYFDPSVGNGTQFIVTYTMSPSSSTAGVSVVLTQPDNTIITSSNQQYNSDTTRKVITISIEGLAMTGKWLYYINNTYPGAQSVTFSVYTRALTSEEEEEEEEDEEPIVVESSVSNSILDLSSRLQSPIAYAQIQKGFRPVVNVNVRAIVERPGGYPPETIQLLDNGAGADITANDGIYSRYFTSITGTGFYGIRVVSENDGAAMILTRAQSGVSRVQASIRVTDDGEIISAGNIGPYEIRLPGVESNQTLEGEPAPSFTRSSSAGSTTVTDVPPGFTPGQDLFPPNRVQDLMALRTHIENLTLVLSWTAPGDDLDVGSASSYDLRIDNSSTQLQNDFANTARITQSSILEGNLTSPKPFGSTETFVIVVADIPEVESFSYSFALTATDDDGQTSPVSNVATATFRRNIDDCLSDPCANGATCVDGIDIYTCTCVAGYTDANCSTDINDCIPDPCMNGATCMDGIDNYTCVCVAGYTDANCSTDINDCLSDPCTNGATCMDGIDYYTCTCIAGYTDANCSTDINDCSPDPCMNGATCVDGIDSYTCTCVAGYTDAHCSTDINDCSSDPCVNGATCVDGIDSYTCTCVAGYTDAHCSTDISACSSDPCVNGATCVGGIDHYTCTCVAGYTDAHCTTDINDCSSDPCMNGATCVDGIDKYTCACVAGYTDTHCLIDINECSSDPCMNGATCMDGIDDYTCACVAGYTDTQCSTDINDCRSFPCLNGAKCVDGIEKYTCTCVAGYTDAHCSTDINDCSSNPCMNGATCVDGIEKYTCACAAGYTDTHCLIDINECSSDPCVNGATCIDGIDKYTCACVAGYTDAQCSADINDCNSDPCMNGATCMDGINNYTCACAAGYTDAQCSTDINDCSPDPCMNGATCMDGIDSYTCTCVAGYTDANCSTDINECSDTSPCANGRCVNTDGSYFCLCNFSFVLNEARDTCTAISNSGLSTSRVTTRLTGTSLNGEELVWGNDLLDMTSQRFVQYQNKYCATFINFLRGRFSGLLGVNCFVASFSSGSVIATMELELLASTQTAADGIAQDLINLSGVANNNITSNEDFLETSAISTSDGTGGGLAAGATIGIALGVLGFFLILIVLNQFCCIFMQSVEVKRSPATKQMQSDLRNAEAGNGDFHEGDVHNDSLDERRYDHDDVGRDLSRIPRDDISYHGSFDEERGIHHHEDPNFSTPYVVDGSESIGEVILQ